MHLFLDNTPAMSLLGQGSSSRNVLPDNDNFDRQFDGAQQSGFTDGFGDDADDDDLSLDGIYDDDDDQDVPPPTSAFSKISGTRGEPVASTGSTFTAQTAEIFGPDSTFRSPLVTPGHAPMPHRPLVVPSSSLSHGPSVTGNAPPRTYYPGVDVCIVRTLPCLFSVEY